MPAPEELVGRRVRLPEPIVRIYGLVLEQLGLAMSTWVPCRYRDTISLHDGYAASFAPPPIGIRLPQPSGTWDSRALLMNRNLILYFRSTPEPADVTYPVRGMRTVDDTLFMGIELKPDLHVPDRGRSSGLARSRARRLLSIRARGRRRVRLPRHRILERDQVVVNPQINPAPQQARALGLRSQAA
jgi:hypothetical protein